MTQEMDFTNFREESLSRDQGVVAIEKKHR